MRQRNSLASDRVLVRATAKENAQIYLVDVVFNTEEGTSPLNHSPMATASASLSASIFRDENVFFFEMSCLEEGSDMLQIFVCDVLPTGCPRERDGVLI